ncbi:MAG TPA: hypothetical protein VK936_02965 [Longimicrobiales bacterium]|nr:hypothetical protein [Longimicrobiales bacterium]
MRSLARIVPAALVAVIAGACATVAARAPLTDVPAGTYVLVEPVSDQYNAVAINEHGFVARMGNATHAGRHWVDPDGRLRMADEAGPCAGQESIWTHQYANNRVTLELIQDLCTVRATPFPQRMVYERR